jgi:hypothetical protein
MERLSVEALSFSLVVAIGEARTQYAEYIELQAVNLRLAAVRRIDIHSKNRSVHFHAAV